MTTWKPLEEGVGASVFFPASLLEGGELVTSVSPQDLSEGWQTPHHDTDGGNTGLFTHFLYSSLLMLCLH